MNLGVNFNFNTDVVEMSKLTKNVVEVENDRSAVVKGVTEKNILCLRRETERHGLQDEPSKLHGLIGVGYMDTFT